MGLIIVGQPGYEEDGKADCHQYGAVLQCPCYWSLCTGNKDDITVGNFLLLLTINLLGRTEEKCPRPRRVGRAFGGT